MGEYFGWAESAAACDVAATTAPPHGGLRLLRDPGAAEDPGRPALAVTQYRIWGVGGGVVATSTN